MHKQRVPKVRVSHQQKQPILSPLHPTFATATLHAPNHTSSPPHKPTHTASELPQRGRYEHNPRLRSVATVVGHKPCTNNACQRYAYHTNKSNPYYPHFTRPLPQPHCTHPTTHRVTPHKPTHTASELPQRGRYAHNPRLRSAATVVGYNNHNQCVPEVRVPHQQKSSPNCHTGHSWVNHYIYIYMLHLFIRHTRHADQQAACSSSATLLSSVPRRQAQE